MIFRKYLSGLSLLVAVGLLTACTDAEESAGPVAMATEGSKASPLLVYVPDDTPYVLANSERLPDHLLDLMWKMGEPALLMMQERIKNGVASVADNSNQKAHEKLLSAVLSEFDGKMNREGLAQLGIEPRGNMAFYGIGVLPVLRAEIADTALLEATIKRVETAAGTTFPRQNMGGVDYFEVGDDEGALIISIAGNQLLLAMLPQKVKAALLPQVLGIEMPARSMADSGRLDAINKEFGLTGYSTLLVDLPRLADAILSDESEAASVLFGDERAKLSQSCHREYREIAAVAPRLVAGYKEISATRMEQFIMLELRSDLAAGLSGITASMPGLGQPEDVMAHFAMALDIIKAKQFIQGRLDALRQDPYECENMASMNAELELMEQRLNQPLPPFAGNIRGVRVNVSSFDLTTGSLPTVNGLLMVAMSNPQLVLGMGQAFVPQLAELTIPLDGQPVALPADLIPVDVEAPHIAMTDAAIGLSLGTGEELGLADFLNAEVPDGPVFASMGYTGEALALYHSQALSMTSADADHLGAAIDAIALHTTILERVMVSVSFTDRGIEASTVYHLNP